MFLIAITFLLFIAFVFSVYEHKVIKSEYSESGVRFSFISFVVFLSITLVYYYYK